VAQYYWATDLRNGTNCSVTVKGPDGKDKTVDVCTNNVPSSTADPAKYQHLNTFGIGLGVNGTLKSGDFADLKTGKKTWPSPFNNEGAVRIDDLWHAAVNGRGEYYSALSATALSSAIAGVIAKIDEVEWRILCRRYQCVGVGGR
jgi:type IV pilus assembly protein PilY1